MGEIRKMKNSQLYFYFKLLHINTNKIYKLINQGNRYQLKILTNKNNWENISKFLTKSEIYEVIYSLNNLASIDDKEPGLKSVDMSKEQFNYISKNLHDDKIIKLEDVY